MNFHRHKLTSPEIVILGGIGALTIYLSSLTLSLKPTAECEIKKAAAVKTAQAYEAIKEYRLKNGFGIDSLDDPQESGLIGVDKSIITTDAGDLESKLTSINPNWAATVIDNLIQANVKKGDVVAIGMTGSFPAMNTAVIIALETYGVRPLWIASEGSSNWGANIPGLTWLDLESILHDQGFIKGKALASTLGGANNAGGGLTHEGRETLRKAIQKNQIPLIETLPLSATIEKQIAAFNQAAGGDPIRLYINIGGGLGSLGTSRVAGVLNPGLNSPRTFLEIQDEPVQGNVAYFMRRGVSVLNLLNVVALARSSGLPVAPGAMPDPGIGPLFSKLAYSVWMNAALFLLYATLVLAVVFGLTESIVKNPRKEQYV
jgi:poly-gamma-glutamate system protein